VGMALLTQAEANAHCLVKAH